MNPRHVAFALSTLLVACGSAPKPPAEGPDAPAMASPRDDASPSAPDGEAAAATERPRPAEPAPMPPPMPMLHAAPDPEPAAGPRVIQVDIINRCSERLDFCVITGRSERKTRLAPSTHEWYRMRPGDSVRAMDGAYCGEVLYEVKAGPDEQKAVLCK